jgi:glycosyltransferase involved in cell wall biosynthesis
LIPEKGVQVLIEALTILRRAGQPLTATIVGDGEERDSLEQLAKRNHLEQCLLFTGAVTGGALAGLLNRHRLMVVPSTYHEPFGIVALEGIACGCVVIGSQAGGLPEAIGPCGTTVRPANPALLAAEIRDVLAGRRELAGFPKLAEAHLAAHRAEAVASRYLELLRRLAQPALSARKAETSRRPNFENVSRA